MLKRELIAWIRQHEEEHNERAKGAFEQNVTFLNQIAKLEEKICRLEERVSFLEHENLGFLKERD